MFIQNIIIDSYKILKDIEIPFLPPVGKGNSVNILAGVNGSGKTSLLNLIFSMFDPAPLPPQGGTFEALLDDGTKVIGDEGGKSFIKIEGFPQSTIRFTPDLTSYFTDNNEFKNGTYSSPRVIYIPVDTSFNYHATSQLDKQYRFNNRIDASTLVGNAELFIKEFIISNERTSEEPEPKPKKKTLRDS